MGGFQSDLVKSPPTVYSVNSGALGNMTVALPLAIGTPSCWLLVSPGFPTEEVDEQAWLSSLYTGRAQTSQQNSDLLAAISHADLPVTHPAWG